jgi:PAS domain S-box-containing protein
VSKSELLAKFEAVANTFPTPFYWLDLEQKYLGLNQLSLEMLNSDANCTYRPKTPYDIYPKVMADRLVRRHRQVIETGHTLQLEESISDTKGNICHYITTIAPLYDDQKNIIGTSGASLANANSSKLLGQSVSIYKGSTVFKYLEQIANIVPAPFYWSDTNCHCLGANKLTLEAIGIENCPEKLISKTVYNVYPKEIADKLVENQRTVIKSNKPLIAKESIVDTKGRLKHYEAIITPLQDDQGSIIGTYGISIDITRKEQA